MKALRSFIASQFYCPADSGIASQFYCPADSGIASQCYSSCDEWYYASHSDIVLTHSWWGRGEIHTPISQGAKKEAVH